MPTELLDKPRELSLPNYEDDLTPYSQDVEDLLRALECPEGYSYEARLPQVVGFMPSEEALALESIKPNYIHHSFSGRVIDRDDYQAQIEAAAPTALGLIRHDVDQTSQGASEIRKVEVRKLAINEGEPIDREDEREHTDIGVKDQEDARQTIYLVSSADPTHFYQGPATLIHKHGMLRLDHASLDTNAISSMVTAPQLAIVRMTFATVHASPQAATQTTTRILVRAFSDPIQT